MLKWVDSAGCFRKRGARAYLHAHGEAKRLGLSSAPVVAGAQCLGEVEIVELGNYQPGTSRWPVRVRILTPTRPVNQGIER